MSRRLKIACIATIVFKYSHAQHFLDRFLEGYGFDGRHHRPEMDLVSLYVDQIGEGDLSADRAARHPQLTIYPSVAEALTLGGDSLAVDGVLLIGEHGDYPKNEKGQTPYPRYELFQQIVGVFEASGRSVPVFNDKHLSWNWAQARAMYDTARRLGFAFQAGSSLPVTWRTPSIDLPLDTPVTEGVCVGYGGVDSYDFHALETLQCLMERRAGGESGVVRLQAYRGDAFWKAHHERLWSRALFDAALCRSHTLASARPGFNHVFPTVDELKALVKDPIAYVYEHVDGARSSMLLLNGLVQDFNAALAIPGQEKPFSVQMYLPMPPARTTLANFFSPQIRHAETMFATGVEPYPLERTLLTTGLTEAGVESLFQDQRPIDTPHLEGVAYRSTPHSTFWRS